MQNEFTSRHLVLSGCSGGGKSTLLEELKKRGFNTVPEPGRRVVESEIARMGKALPWVNPEAFARRALAIASHDRQRMRAVQGWVFFDRGLVDAAVALQHATGQSAHETLKGTDRHHTQVFLTPPWPEIFRTDSARRKGMDEAIDEYDRLLAAYGALGYETIALPKINVEARADFLVGCLR